MYYDIERRDGPVTLDMAVPLCNEEEVIPIFLQRLFTTFSPENRAEHGISGVTYIFIDDGSKDTTVEKLIMGFREEPGISVRIVCLSRNFGHQAAISAGIDHSNASLLAIIDADLQDPPELILKMVDKWREGYEVVHAQRMSRQDNVIKKTFYWIFYRVYRFLANIDVVLDSGDFCLMSKEVVEVLKKLPESIKFPRGLRSWVGFRQIRLPYDRGRRVAGVTKYTFRKLYQLATDGITSISIRPLKLAQFFSLMYFIISLLTLGTILGYINVRIDQSKALFILLGVMLFSNALVMGYLYIIGAYIGRAYLESKRRPPYIVHKIIDPTAVKK